MPTDERAKWRAKRMDEPPGTTQPQLIVGRGWAVYVGPVEPGRSHRHQAAQLVWAPLGSLCLEGAWGELNTPGHFLPAGVMHRLTATHAVRMVFLDPTMPAMASPHGASSAVALTAAQAEFLEHDLMLWLRAREDGCPKSPKPQPQAADADRRWQTTLAWMERALDGPVRVEDAAKAVALSTSRFMHWFVDTTGLPFRAYVRWLRVQHAIRSLSDGSSLTEAAHLAGFADSAHLSRSFVATFGVRPGSLLGARVVCDDRSEPPVTPPHAARLNELHA